MIKQLNNGALNDSVNVGEEKVITEYVVSYYTDNSENEMLILTYPVVHPC